MIAIVRDRLPACSDVPTMTGQGAVGGSCEMRAFADTEVMLENGVVGSRRAIHSSDQPA